MPHPRPWRPCGGVPGLRAGACELQQLPRPALPEVPAQGAGGMDRDEARGGHPGSQILPCGVHRPRLPPSLGHARAGTVLHLHVPVGMGHPAQILPKAGPAGRHERHPPHLGIQPFLPPAHPLRGDRRGCGQGWRMAPFEGLQGWQELPVSRACPKQGVPGKDDVGPDRGIVKDRCGHREKYPESGDVERLGRLQPSAGKGRGAGARVRRPLRLPRRHQQLPHQGGHPRRVGDL